MIDVKGTRVLKMTSLRRLADGEKVSIVYLEDIRQIVLNYFYILLPVKHLQLFIQRVKALLSEPPLVQNHVHRKECRKEP